MSGGGNDSFLKLNFLLEALGFRQGRTQLLAGHRETYRNSAEFSGKKLLKNFRDSKPRIPPQSPLCREPYRLKQSNRRDSGHGVR